MKEAIAITTELSIADRILQHYINQRSKTVTIRFEADAWWILIAPKEFHMTKYQPFLHFASPYRNWIQVEIPINNKRKVIT